MAGEDCVKLSNEEIEIFGEELTLWGCIDVTAIGTGIVFPSYNVSLSSRVERSTEVKIPAQLIDIPPFSEAITVIVSSTVTDIVTVAKLTTVAPACAAAIALLADNSTLEISTSAREADCRTLCTTALAEFSVSFAPISLRRSR